MTRPYRTEWNRDEIRRDGREVLDGPNNLTPPEIAKFLRVSPEKVLGWIRRAELAAISR
jgi:hypothetical protein